MRKSDGTPLGTRKFKPIPQGAGGQLIKLSVAKDGARLVCADIHGAYAYYGTDDAKPLFTATSLPSALIPADHTRVGFSGGTYNDSTGCADAVFAPSDSTNIWMIVDGQLCLSTDSGDTFAATGAPRSQFNSNGGDNKSYGAHRITVDPDNPSVVLFGTDGNDVHYSTNKGVSFTALGLPATYSGTLSSGATFSGKTSPATSGGHGLAPHFTACDPTSTQSGGIRQKWYYTIDGVGIYESTTGPGGSYTLMSGSPTHPTSFTCDGNGTLWATQSGATENIYKHPAGGSWSNISTGLGQNFNKIAVDKTKGWVVAQSGLGTYYISRDGGTTWNSTDRWTNSNANSPAEQIHREKDIRYLDIPAPQQYTNVANQMFFDPTVPGRLWTATWIDLTYCDVPTTGGGSAHPLNWFGIGKGIEEAVCHTAHFTSAGKLWLGNWDLGARRIDSLTRLTNPQCAAYKPGDTISNGFRHPTLVQPCASIDSAMDDPYYVAFLQWGGWSSDPQSHPHVGRATDGENPLPFPTDPSNIPTGNGGGNIAVGAAGNVAIAWNVNRLGETTLDDGETWTPWSIPGMIDGDNGIDVTGNGGYFLNRVDLTHDKLGHFYLFVSGNGQTPNPVGIYRSPDGVDWSDKRHTGAPAALGGQFGYQHANHTRAVPGVADHLWITNGDGGKDYTGVLIRSTDGGTTWSASGLTTNGGQTISNVTDISFGKGIGTYAYSIHFWGAVNGVTGAWSSYDGLVTCVLDEDFPANSTAPMLQVVADRNSTHVVLCSDGNGAFWGDLEDTVNVGA